MRIAIVYDCLYPHSRGGGERVYRRMAELLATEGAEVDYLTRSGQADDDHQDAFRVVPIWDGEIARLDGTRSIRSALGFAMAVRAALRRRRGDYDVIIASALPVLTLLAARVGAGRGAVIVADWLEVWTWRKWRSYSGVIAGTVALVLQALGSRSAVVHTVNSQFTAERLAAIAPSAQIVVLGLFDLIPPPAAPRPMAAPPTVVFLGRLIADKRAVAIPGAIASARTRIPELRAVIAGDGPERTAILTEVERLGLQHVIDVPGHVDAATAERLVATAVAMVNPSAREGFGLVVVEAAAVGVPSVVIAGDDNAAADLIEPGRNGVIAPDLAGLDDAIVDVVNAGPALRRSTVEWYRSRANEESLSRSLDRVLALVAPSTAGRPSR